MSTNSRTAFAYYYLENGNYLTPREYSVLINAELLNREIAEKLKISVRTVEMNIKNILMKIHKHKKIGMVEFLRSPDFKKIEKSYWRREYEEA